MTVFLNNFLIALPLFALVGLGYLFASLRLVTPEIGKALSKFAFTVAIPTLLFRLMSNITQLPAPKLGVPISIALLPCLDAGACRDLRSQRVPHVDLRDGAD